MAYTTNWKPIEPELNLQQIADTSTTQNHPLGKRVHAQDYGSSSNGVAEFIYLKGLAATAAGTWVIFNPDDYSTTLLAANAVGFVAISMSANLANQYGWYQITGKAVGKALAAFADDANVYATATAGSVDDAVVAGDRVKNAKGASALDVPATGMAEFELQYPFMDDGLAA